MVVIATRFALYVVFFAPPPQGIPTNSFYNAIEKTSL